MELINVKGTGPFLITNTNVQKLWVWSLMNLCLYLNSAENKLHDLEQTKLHSLSEPQCFHLYNDGGNIYDAHRTKGDYIKHTRGSVTYRHSISCSYFYLFENILTIFFKMSSVITSN